MDNFAYKTLAVVASPVKRIVGTDACWAYSVHVKHGLHQAARQSNGKISILANPHGVNFRTL